MDIIKLLPDSVANQIAAGEVIQRPASVVKELVENAVDAGATSIQIIIKDAGRTLIQVIDNGSGMSDTDARLAFERHSTSKITQAGDLFTLHTMGFRGEALASIAAVAQVELKTMLRDQSLGTRLLISGSKVELQEPVASVPGTNLMVKNLFFNVPARRKFLKKDAVEMSNILHEFERLALVNPEVELTLVSNDTVVHQLMKGSLKQRIGNLFGKSIEKQIIPVQTETSLVKLSGFVGLPENARRRGALQYFFVNGRNMRHPYFHKAVLHCYEELIRADVQPNYFLNFEVDPSTIDVNIHPTKNEIKFENEQPIWQILVAAIKESLGKFNAVPAIDFNAVDDGPELPAFNPTAGADIHLSVESDYNPFEATSKAASHAVKPSSINSWQHDQRSALDDWEKLYQQFSSAPAEQLDVPATPVPERLDIDNGDIAPVAPALMQLKNRYILSQSRSGLTVIDQHRAHLRILFERFIATDVAIPSQKVMFPQVITITQAQNAILEQILEQVENAGYQLAFLGDCSWAVNGIPSVEGLSNPEETIRNIVDDVAAGVDITRESIHNRIALNLAKSAAIPAGRRLTSAEMEHLVSDLLSLSAPAYTPDGAKIILEIPLTDLDKSFA